jgi:hypothetical protein
MTAAVNNPSEKGSGNGSRAFQQVFPVLATFETWWARLLARFLAAPTIVPSSRSAAR